MYNGSHPHPVAERWHPGFGTMYLNLVPGPALAPIGLPLKTQARPGGGEKGPLGLAHVTGNLPHRRTPQSSLSTELSLHRDRVGIVVRDDLSARP